jgi:hypothetical protein
MGVGVYPFRDCISDVFDSGLSRNDRLSGAKVDRDLDSPMAFNALKRTSAVAAGHVIYEKAIMVFLL